MPYLLTFWREIAIVGLCVSFYAYLGFKNSEMKDLVIERNQYKSALEFQNASILQQSKVYELRLKELPKEIIKIKTRYDVIYTDIDNFKKDENESDCNASYRMLSTFNY